jgi:hypothetical protein
LRGTGNHENCTWVCAGHRLRNDGFCASFRGRGAHGGARSSIERPVRLSKKSEVNGSLCGRGSAYCRCGGRDPMCYPGDDVPVKRRENMMKHCGHNCEYKVMR